MTRDIRNQRRNLKAESLIDVELLVVFIVTFSRWLGSIRVERGYTLLMKEAAVRHLLLRIGERVLKLRIAETG
jgi:hypothetical protein